MSASPSTNEPPKMSLAKRINRIAVFPLLGLAIIAMLTSLGFISYGSCEWTLDPGKAATPRGPKDALLGTVSLIVKAGDKDVLKQLREGVVEGLTKAGVQTVSNSVTWPKVEIIVEEQRGRWTPFWAPLFVKTRVFVDMKKRDARVVDAALTLEGKCTGLVGKDLWRFDWVPQLTDEVVKQILRTP